ncbi:MAG: S8 family serine peptidase [Candidatus Nanopelagicales bacterium]
MIRRLSALTAAAALAFAGLALPPSAIAEQTDDQTPGPTVEVSTTGSYIVVMEADPLIVDNDVEDLRTPKVRAKEARLVASHKAVLEEVGADPADKVQDFTNALNGFSATITHDEALALAAQKTVKLVQPDELRQLQTDSAGTFLGLTGRGAAWSSGLEGEGVVVGVIDSGIWPEHPSFADDGSYPKPDIPPMNGSKTPTCDFGDTAHNANDKPFTCNNKLVGARQMLATYRNLIGAAPDEFDSARDDDGHGTHTASTAAGNAGVKASIFGKALGTLSGIAPRAQIIAYKGLGNQGGFNSDLAASIDQAVADGVDVINYSVGGGPSLNSVDDIAYLYAANAGVFVATSAGNDGPGAGTIGGPASVPWITTVGASTQDRFFGGTATLGTSGYWPWRDKTHHRSKNTKVSGASITKGTARNLPLVDAEFAGGDLCLPGTLDAAKVKGTIVLCRRGSVGRAEKSLAVSQAGGAGMILYNTTNDDNLFTDTHTVPSLHVDYDEGLVVKDYIKETHRPRATITTGELTTWKHAPTMAIFSSRGPNPVAQDLIKPDVTAPGVQILAGNSPFPDPGAVQGELFQAIAGTSMSSPMVAGLFALLKEEHPDWTAAMAKSALMTTAYQKVRDNDRTSAAGPFAMGAGHVDPGRVNRKGSAFKPGLVYDAGLLEYAGFSCGTGEPIFTADTCDFLATAGIPSDASDLNLPSIGIAELPGSQTVTRTVTSVANRTVRWSAKVDAPKGYDVTVSPRRLTLRPGQSASFEVTISNNGGGPVGQWRFGSLKWRGGGYTARSPIAVKGSLFNAPPSVSGTGTEGSGALDITFGYSGAYSAAAHGLAADAPVDGVIEQDPDQEFPSTDDGAGVGRIEFPVNSSAFARWSLQIPGADDLDLYLENSDGEVVASSTNGGTDETIELTLPADDTYTLVVHGWSVPSAPLPYTVQFWDVPVAPSTGTLTVDSAPSSATIGSVERIGFSWSDLTAGTDYLGAISHSNADEIMGLTLVQVAG